MFPKIFTLSSSYWLSWLSDLVQSMPPMRSDKTFKLVRVLLFYSWSSIWCAPEVDAASVLGDGHRGLISAVYGLYEYYFIRKSWTKCG